MLLIVCPHCGRRNEDEFVYGGDATVTRPRDPAAVSDADWLSHIYLRDNPKGPHTEWWYHMHGCGAWLAVSRDTVTHRITGVVSARARARGRAQ